jgi:hypothetical protein
MLESEHGVIWHRYLIGLTIGPVFFAASIYLTLSRIIVYYGPQHSRFPPKTITLLFVSCDFVALVLQAVGGAIADTADSRAVVQAGTHTMVGGLSFQVLSLLIFVGISCEFVMNVRRAKKEKPNGKSERWFRWFLVGNFALNFLNATAFVDEKHSIGLSNLLHLDTFLLPCRGTFTGVWREASE